MKEINSDILELGRGAKHLWHQVVLKIDLLNKAKPFIISEIGKDFELLSTNLSIEEIQQEKWKSHLKQCNCEGIIEKITDNVDEMINEWEVLKKTKGKFEGKWITPKVIEVLDYKSNHGNWDYTHDIPGQMKFDFNTTAPTKEQCSVSVAVMSAGGPCYFKRYIGRLELAYNYLLIWQNDIYPVKVRFKWIDDCLELELFGEKIQFKKE